MAADGHRHAAASHRRVLCRCVPCAFWVSWRLVLTRAAVPCTVDAMVLADFKADDREWHDCKEEEALMVDHLTDSLLMSLVEEQVGWLESMG